MVRFSQAYFINFKFSKIFVLCLMNSCRSTLSEMFFKKVIFKFLECILRNISNKESNFSKVEPAKLVNSFSIMSNFLKFFQVYLRKIVPSTRNTSEEIFLKLASHAETFVAELLFFPSYEGKPSSVSQKFSGKNCLPPGTPRTNQGIGQRNQLHPYFYHFPS